MSEFLKMAVSLSISGTLLMGVLCLFRVACKKWTSKCWRYYIWLLIIARLLLPFSTENSIVGKMFGETLDYVEHSQVQTSEVSAPLFIIPEPLHTDVIVANGEVKNTVQWQSVVALIVQNLWAIWLLVALIMLVRKITVYQSFVKYVQAGSTQIDDIELLEQLGKIAAKENVKVGIELSANSLISSPMLIGFFHPCIVLPTTQIASSDFSKIMLHEITHYKRKDMFYKWIIQITICLHWFNPFVYIMGRMISQDCELSCDEAVMHNLDIAAF